MPTELTFLRGRVDASLLADMVRLAAMAKGVVPVHASACLFQGRGILTAGWAGGGKTGVLLALMAAGADFLSDDWVYVTQDGTHLLGSAAPLEIKSLYLDQLPEIRCRLSQVARADLSVQRAAPQCARAALSLLPRGCVRLRKRLARLVDREPTVCIHPHSLFGETRCPTHAALDTVLVALPHGGTTTTVRQASTDEVADRLFHSLSHELGGLLARYRGLRFAFPELEHPFLDELPNLLRGQLHRVLAGKQLYVLSHPVPLSTAAVTDAISSLFSDGAIEPKSAAATVSANEPAFIKEAPHAI